MIIQTLIIIYCNNKYDVCDNCYDPDMNKEAPSTNTNIFKNILFDLFPNLQNIIINTTSFVGDGQREYRIGLLSLLALMKNANNINITIRAQHKYKTHSIEK